MLSLPEKILEEKWKKEDEAKAIENLRRVIAADPKAARELIWYLLETGDVFDSIWDPGAKIHYNAGRQDFARSILHLTDQASPESLAWMMSQAQTVYLSREKEREKALKSEGE